MSALPLSLHKKEMPNRISFLQGAPSATPNSIHQTDCRIKCDNNTTYSKKYFFCHCERSAAVHFLDCHVALLLAMTKQKKLVATFIDIPNLQFCSAKLEMSDNKRSLLNYTFTDINSKFRAIQ